MDASSVRFQVRFARTRRPSYVFQQTVSLVVLFDLVVISLASQALIIGRAGSHRIQRNCNHTNAVDKPIDARHVVPSEHRSRVNSLPELSSVRVNSLLGGNKRDAMIPLKNVCYRGGIARFEIPASWIEEYEPVGGATFYEDRPDSGTFRLNVLSFSSNGKETGEQMVADLIAKSGYQALDNGLAIKHYVKQAEEHGESLLLHYWEVAVPVVQSSARLAIFSYTILASQANDHQVQREIELLGRCVCAGDFSREEGVSGDAPCD